MLKACTHERLSCSLSRSLWASCGSAHVPGLHLGVQAKEAALLWDVPFLQPRKRQQTAPQTPAPVLLIPSLLTAQGHTSHISHTCCLGWGGVGTGPGPPSSEDMCRSQSHEWGWIILFQGGQPVIGNNNTLTALCPESLRYFGGWSGVFLLLAHFRCPPTTQNHDPRRLGGLSNYKRTVRVHEGL